MPMQTTLRQDADTAGATKPLSELTECDVCSVSRRQRRNRSPGHSRVTAVTCPGKAETAWGEIPHADDAAERGPLPE